jgi:N-methylhydantoinase A
MPLNTAMPIDLRALARGKGKPDCRRPKVSRPVWFEGGWREARVRQRDTLVPGMRFIGPAIVEQLDTTTVIQPEQEAAVDEYRNIIVKEKKA